MNWYKECTTIEEVSLEYKRLYKSLRAERNAPYEDRFDQLRSQQWKRQEEIKQKLDKETHLKVKDWQEGEKIYMNKISKMDLDLFAKGAPHYNSFNKVTYGIVYHYQPKKKLLWLRFTKKQVTESQWHDNHGNPIQPFRMNEVRKNNLRRTDI